MASQQAQIFGDFIERPKKNVEYLVMGFSPSSIPLQQRWRNNGLSADFLADYLQTFFIVENKDTLELQTEIKDAVNYIANELLENAMKFNDESAQYPTSIALHLLPTSVVFYVTNSVNQESIEKFQNFIERLLSENLEELYLQQLEQNADPQSTQSGLGFLTMMQDYHAQLGWKFETTRNEESGADVTMVTTMVQLNAPSV